MMLLRGGDGTRALRLFGGNYPSVSSEQESSTLSMHAFFPSLSYCQIAQDRFIR